MLADVGHIIVVDDDPSLRQLVTRYLEDHNVPTKTASNKAELNRHFEGSVPSLIILDLRLGQEDGFDLLRALRKIAAFLNLCESDCHNRIRGCGYDGSIRFF